MPDGGININGRICLETLLPFGLVGVVLVKFVNPLIFRLLESFPQNFKVIILIIITLLFILDVIVSFSIIFNFRKNVKNTENEIKDNTDEIVEKVKEEAENRLEEIEYKISLRLYETKKHVVYKSAKLQKRIEMYKLRVSEELEETRKKLEKIAQKFIYSSNEIKKNLENVSSEWKKKTKEDKQLNIAEITKLVKEKFSKKSKLSNRLLKAFPKMEVKMDNKNKK